ncbi:hypothetical protein DPMN_079205 [Dreissena polymorpha]|uniref:Uncharacterized protein n=1 Tax=Dreissena polymorpha TaxID=45954 RepID=A0A9D3YSP3_DREPO|nr:hypothetical protein DPMN_079205 [Dreissena polymorpha]
MTNVLTKFHDDKAKNVTSRPCFFTDLNHFQTQPSYPGNKCSDQKKTAPPPGGHVFSPIWTIFEFIRDINTTNVLTKFHDNWAKIVPSRVFTRNTAPPPDWASNVTFTVFTSFKLGRGIIWTNVLTKFHEDRIRNVASRVFTR